MIRSGLFVCLGLIAIALALYIFQSTFPSSPPSLQPSSAPSHSLVTKVTSLYGKGAWIETEVPDIATKLSSDTRQSNLERAVAIHKHHAHLHDHKQIVQSTQLFGGRINDAYTKIGNLLEQNLVEMSLGEKGGAKWLFWHDVDTVILNNRVSLDTFVADLPGIENFNFLYAADYNGLNAGLLFLRVSEWTSLFLANILTLGRPQGTPQLPFWEQGAIVACLQENPYYKKASLELPKHWFNVYPNLTTTEPLHDWQDLTPTHSFLIHMAGDTKFKPGWFDYYLSIGENDAASAHDPSAALSLRAEVIDFWNARQSP